MRYRRFIGLCLTIVLAMTGCKNVGNENEQKPTVTPSPFVESEEPTGDVAEEEDTSIPSNATLDEVKNAVVKQMGDDYIANMPYDCVTVKEIFGIEPEWYDAGIAEGPMMSTNIDKFLVFHATEGNLANIQNALNTYRNTIIADTMQYPMNVLKTQGALVETIGDYVFFVMLGFVDNTVYEKDEDIIAAHTAINQAVIETAREIIAQR